MIVLASVFCAAMVTILSVPIISYHTKDKT